MNPWRSWPALRITLPGLSLSLATSCIGYLALAWTPFPALTQIAIFSAAGLVGAYLSAVCLLPALLKGVELRPAQWPLRIAECLTEQQITLRLSVITSGALPVLKLRWVGEEVQREDIWQRVQQYFARYSIRYLKGRW